jgi:hypothetical protein
MPDITMCAGYRYNEWVKSQCPIKTKCYRFTAEPKISGQSYMPAPYNFETDSCEYFECSEYHSIEDNNGQA